MYCCVGKIIFYLVIKLSTSVLFTFGMYFVLFEFCFAVKSQNALKKGKIKQDLKKSKVSMISKRPLKSLSLSSKNELKVSNDGTKRKSSSNSSEKKKSISDKDSSIIEASSPTKQNKDALQDPNKPEGETAVSTPSRKGKSKRPLLGATAKKENICVVSSLVYNFLRAWLIS